MKAPTEPGYYWARLFSIGTKPCIVYVNDEFVVSACGDRSRYSFSLDVKEWCSGKLYIQERTNGRLSL